MRTYQAEKDAGIDFQENNKGNASAVVTAQVHVRDIAQYFDGMSISDLIRQTTTVQTVEELLGEEQPDLALIVAILVSTGWNLNDDIFTPNEVWKARKTPLHKPMNDHHNAECILGHIVKSRVLDKAGVEINLKNGETPPDEFDVEVAGVLYKAFPAISERIDEIISQANAGNMFVSMECWFPDFGYGFVNPDTNDISLIDRNEATAFLTKHLKIYGGSGKYQDYKIGRVPKDIIFGAQGFVNTPANPESVIKVAASSVATSKNFVAAELDELLEGGVKDVDEKQIKELQTKLEEAQGSLTNKEKEIVELKKAIEEFKANDYEGQIATLKEDVEKLTANVTEASDKAKTVEGVNKAHTELNSELQGKLDEAIGRADKSEAELVEIRKTESARERFVKLSEVKEIDDKDATLAELREMTDETFELVLKFAGNNKADENTNQEPGAVNDEGAAQAALENAQVDDSADLNVAGDATHKESDKWLATASALCGRKEKENEGGE